MIKYSVILAPVVVLIAAATLTAASRLTSVEPTVASPGAEIVATGTELAADDVDLLFLTVGSTDIAVEIVEQAADHLRFRLPADVPSGQYNLMLQTAGDTPALLVQPVMCEVLGEAEAAERKAEEERAQQELDAALAADAAEDEQ